MNTTKFDKLMSMIKQMTQHSQQDWATIEADERREKAVLEHAREMMKRASRRYRRALIITANPDELQDLTRFWSPKRMLSIDPEFASLCIALENVDLWNQLRRHERQFLTQAYEFTLKGK